MGELPGTATERGGRSEPSSPRWERGGGKRAGMTGMVSGRCPAAELPPPGQDQRCPPPASVPPGARVAVYWPKDHQW